MDARDGSEALRIQAAAVVAQQAALFEREQQLTEREAALARQEEQVAEHLESKRRQLLELQDQITEARAALREKRAVHAALAERHQKELAAAREEAADLQREARAERQRLHTLRQRMIQRWRRHWSAQRGAVATATADLARERQQFDAAKAAFAAEVTHFHTQAELEKRRLRDEARQLAADVKEWQSRRAEQTRALAEEMRALVRRSKAVAAEERRVAAEKQNHDRELRERLQEFEHLETRIGNARWQLLEHQQELLKLDETRAAGFIPAERLPTGGDEPRRSPTEQALEQRTETLARVAAELADQRLLLAEQAQRLVKCQEEWIAERAAALGELTEVGTRLQKQEQELTLRAHAVETAEERIRATRAALAQARLQLDAERVRGEGQTSARSADLDRRTADLECRERAVERLRDRSAELCRHVGQRLRSEVEALRAARRGCLEERAEWAAARAVWLRLGARAQDDRKAVAAQALALEEMRKQLVAAIDRPAADRQLERLKRQWRNYCTGIARDLNRLRATLGAESARLDQRATRAADEARAIEARVVEVEECRADLERRQAEIAAAEANWALRLEQALARQKRAEKRADELRGEADRLASLLINDEPAAALHRAA
jgi:DNA repair exonuclease SbcCD ATPase subunit